MHSLRLQLASGLIASQEKIFRIKPNDHAGRLIGLPEIV